MKAGIAITVILMIAMSSVSALIANDDGSGDTGSLLIMEDPYIDRVNVTLNATDDWSGVVATVFKIVNETDWLPYQGTFSIEGVGEYTILFYSIDQAGNIEETKSISFSIATDVLAPVTTCILEGDTSYPSP